MKRKVQRKKLVDATGAELSLVPVKELWFEIDTRTLMPATVDKQHIMWDERALARMRSVAEHAAHIFSQSG